jgi:ABC-type lipoprotein export system ATPase subunit
MVDLPPAPRPSAAAPDPARPLSPANPPPRERLHVRGVIKRYPPLTVLDGVDLDVAQGEVVAIRGASGTGKSTLLQCLGLLDRADAGSIRLDGEDLTALAPRARARLRASRIGFVFQAFHLLPEFSVLENILLAARAAGSDLGAACRSAVALLEQVGLAAQARRDIRTLSGGERQRVAICRALLARPALLLADEPTGNLDPATAVQVLAQLLGLARTHRSAVVIVTHDPLIAAQADRQLELRQGRLHPALEAAPASARAAQGLADA